MFSVVSHLNLHIFSAEPHCMVSNFNANFYQKSFSAGVDDGSSWVGLVPGYLIVVFSHFWGGCNQNNLALLSCLILCIEIYVAIDILTFLFCA